MVEVIRGGCYSFWRVNFLYFTFFCSYPFKMGLSRVKPWSPQVLFLVTCFGGLSNHSWLIYSSVGWSILVYFFGVLLATHGSCPLSTFSDVLYITATLHLYLNGVVLFWTLPCQSVFLSSAPFIKSYSSFHYLHVYVHPFNRVCKKIRTRHWICRISAWIWRIFSEFYVLS